MRTYGEIEKLKTNITDLQQKTEDCIDETIDNYFKKSHPHGYEYVVIATRDGYGGRNRVLKNKNWITRLINEFGLSEQSFEKLNRSLIEEYNKNGVDVSLETENVGYGAYALVFRFYPSFKKVKS